MIFIDTWGKDTFLDFFFNSIFSNYLYSQKMSLKICSSKVHLVSLQCKLKKNVDIRLTYSS